MAIIWLWLYSYMIAVTITALCIKKVFQSIPNLMYAYVFVAGQDGFN